MIHTVTRWTLAALGPLALFAPKGLYLPLVIISMVGITDHKFKSVRSLITPVWISLLCFVVWMGLSCFWSINPRISWITLKKVVPLVGLAPLFYLYMASLSSSEFNRHLSLFFKGLWLCIGILILDYFLDYPLIDIIHTNRSATYSRFMTTSCLAIWLFELTQRYPRYQIAFVLFSIATSAWLIFPYDFDAGPVALLLGCLIVVLTLILPKLMNKMIAVGIALAPICVALGVGLFMTQDHWQKIAVDPYSGSSQQRFEMIDWASKHVLSSPVVGIGVGQTPELSIVSPIQSYVTTGGDFQKITLFRSGVLHLHNGLLQILLELGVIGSLLLGLFMVSLIYQGYQQVKNKSCLALMHGYVTTLIFIVSVSFGIWQIWWLSVIIMVTVLFSLRVSDEKQNSVIYGQLA